MSADVLYSKLNSATVYLEKIGRRDQCDGHFGKLHKVDVKTQIAHQEYSGAKNYWEDADFDIALSQAVKESFGALSKRALEIMQSKANAALIAEETELLARLDRIQKLKELQ